MFARSIAALAVVASLIFASEAFALGADLPASQVAQHGPHAVHGYFVNSTDVIFFRADAAGLNEYLGHLAKQGGAKPAVFFHKGTIQARSPWPGGGDGKPADWSTTYNSRASGSAHVDVYVGGQIKRDKVVVPAGVEATDAPEEIEPTIERR